MTAPILKYFAYQHLPEKLQVVSKPIGELAQQLDESLPDGAEKSAGLRKLLEAKDCFVRAMLGVLLVIAALSSVCSAQGTIHGIGDPRTKNPVPNCGYSRFYIDDSSGTMYTAASGSPCSWGPSSMASGINGYIFAAPSLACDGVTDDSVAFQAQVTAAEAAGTVLILPPNKTCVIKSTISVSGVVLWQGNNSTLSWQPSVPLVEMVGGSGITRMDIGGITFQGNGSTVSGIAISGGTNTNIKIHDNILTGITGCPANPSLWNIAQIMLNGARHVKIKDNTITGNGCSSYWNLGGGPSGIAIEGYQAPSYDWDISGNYIDNLYDEFGILLFDQFESTIHDNNIQNVILNAAAEPNQSGYGIAIYGQGICGSTLSGLSRNSSNVVAVTFSGACNPALVPGDHVNINSSTSSGGTNFNGAYTVVTYTGTGATLTSDAAIAYGADTGSGGNIQYAPRLNHVHDNTVKNTAGMGTYLASVTNSTVDNNTYVNVCSSMNDISLPCGFVSVNGGQEVSVLGNNGTVSGRDGVVSANSVATSFIGNNGAGVANGTFRLRGADNTEAWIGNNALGGLDGFLADGAAFSDVLLGNTTFASSGYHIAAFNTGGSGLAIVANMMNSNAVNSASGLASIGGSLNLIALNYARSFLGTAFDLRTVNNLVALNYDQGGDGVVFASGNAYYSLLTNNYVYQASQGFNDSGGHSNVIRDNYVASTTTPFSSISGMTWGNHLIGGSAGVYPVGTCTLVSGTCTITTAEVQSTDSGKIWCTRGSTGSNPGFPYVSSITAGTSFVVTSTSATDTGNVGCRIQH